jgi:hypothetical protein
MQTSRCVAAAFAVAAFGAAAVASADDDGHGTPFDQGRIGLNITVGEQTSFGYNHIALGAGAGYFVLDGLELGAFALHEFGSGPSIDEVSPSIRYVAQPLVGRWPVIPYGAAFYNHWFLGGGFSDLDSVGGRAGLLTLRGRLIVGLGVAVEHVLSACTECNYVYPDVTFGFSF